MDCGGSSPLGEPRNGEKARKDSNFFEHNPLKNKDFRRKDIVKFYQKTLSKSHAMVYNLLTHSPCPPPEPIAPLTREAVIEDDRGVCGSKSWKGN